MQAPARRHDEAECLEALRRYRLLDATPELAFDELASLAGQICKAPISLITVIDEGRQLFKARVGWSLDEMPRDASLCAHVVLQREVFVVSDAKDDPRFAEHPLVTGGPHIRFYAGAPLITSDHRVLGTLCVMDHHARQFTPAQREALAVLGRQVIAQIELRRHSRELTENDARLRLVTDHARVGLVIVNRDRQYEYANRAYAEILGLKSSAITGERVPDVLGDMYETQIRPRLDRAFAGEHVTYELRMPRQTSEDPAIYAVRYEPIEERGVVSRVVVVITDITEMRASAPVANRLAAIVQSSDDAIIGKDLDGIITSWNSGAEKIFGYRAGEIVGTPILRLIPTDRHEEEQRILERIRRGESIQHLETVRLTKDGRALDVSITSSPIKDADGRTIGASKVARDVSERKRSEAVLREREEQLRLYAEHSPVAVAMFDRDMKYLVASRRWIEDYRLGDRPIIGRSHYDVFPDVPQRWRDIHQRCLAGAIEKCDEDPFPRADGRTDWVRWEIRPWHRADGAIGGIIVFSENITQRKQAIEALRGAEERMRFALQSADIGIWDMDYASGVVRWSDTIEAHYGLKPGTFAGTFDAFVARIHPDDRQGLLETVEKSAKSGRDFSTEHRTIWPDGTLHWLRGAGRILLNERGEPVRAVGISQNVTARHLLEAQYQQAQKMEAIGRLAGGLAHDFNNLLTAILGYCELALGTLNPLDPLRTDIVQIQKAGSSAAALTRQLLAFSRKEIIEPVLLDLNVVVADMRGMLGRLIGEDVRIVLGLRPEPALVMADRGQIEQVVLNLAVNARDAMPKGGTLTIETAHVDLDEAYAATHFAVAPGPYVALTITDSGTGMTPEVQAHLFEPFFTTKEQGKGTGLGLATVHGIVSRGGGSITVYSEIGSGTSFKVYFPRAHGAAVAAAAEAPANGARTAGGTQTVLVVEDADGLRELTRRLLTRMGYTVLLAANADEAVRQFAAHRAIDVLLTDVVMPGASGPELTQRLATERPGLKVIYMSGYTEDTIVQHGILKSGIAFLPKPFTSDMLGRKIREVIDRA